MNDRQFYQELNKGLKRIVRKGLTMDLLAKISQIYRDALRKAKTPEEKIKLRRERLYTQWYYYLRLSRHAGLI